MASMTFASIYPHDVTKAEKKGRTVDELHQVIEWLTGYDADRIKALVDAEVTFAEFFDGAQINPNAHMITGSICGYKIQDIQTPTTKYVRYLDKLVDELAKGRPMEKIMRG